MYVFIDANMFLSFYHLTSEDIDELRKLIALIQGNEINLVVSQQLVDEVNRNRATKLADGLKHFDAFLRGGAYPSYCKQYDEYKLMREAHKSFEVHYANLREKILADIHSLNLAADHLVRDIFEAAGVLEIDDDILKRAEMRRFRRNPPGKADSFGDAIHWEVLFDWVPPSADLHIITLDGDFFSPIDKTKIHEFLDAEWRSKIKSTAHLYTSLSAFLKKYFPLINISRQEELNSLIARLKVSPNFRTTHEIIGALKTFDFLTARQKDEVLTALATNNQVRWIFSDDDVFSFYEPLFQNYDQAFHTHWGELDEIYEKGQIERDTLQLFE